MSRRLAPSASILLLALGSLALACGHRHPHGDLDYVELHSRSEGRPLRYGVHLPPGWDQTSALPLVVLLHGAGDDETSADRRVVTERIDEAITSGTVPPFLMVTPEGERGFWVNWSDGSHHWRDWVLEEVVPDVRTRYPIVEGAEGLHLVGVSMGGGGGMQMWLHEPALFASATILSAPILDRADTWEFLRRFVPQPALERIFGAPGSSSGIDPYQALCAPEDLHGSRLLFGAASRDHGDILGSNERFHEHLRGRSIPHQLVEFQGRHGWEAWSKVFPLALCHQLQDECTMPVPEGWSMEGSAVP